MAAFAGIDVSNVLLAGMKTAERNGKYIANNIANADTPNYTPKRLDFQKSLRAALEGRGGIALRTSRPQHLDFSEDRPQFEGLAFLSKNDYNKVDLDQEVTELSENTSRYTTYASLLGKKFEEAKYTLDSLAR